MINNKQHYKISFILLLLTATFWGCGFVFSEIMLTNGMPSSLINTMRFIIASIALAIAFGKDVKLNKKVILGGAMCGLALFVGFEVQLFALNYTTPAQNGLFTGSYILFVPFIVWACKKRKPSLWTMVGIFVALVGFYVLSKANHGDDTIKDPSLYYIGNILTVVSAIAFAVHISLVDWLLEKPEITSKSLTIMQIVFTALFFIIFFLATALRSTDWSAISWKNTWWVILAVGLLCSAFAYTSQSYAQQHINPATVSLIMALESPIGAIASVVTGHDYFSWQLVVGCILVTTSLILVEFLPNYLAERKKKAEKIS